MSRREVRYVPRGLRYEYVVVGTATDEHPHYDGPPFVVRRYVLSWPPGRRYADPDRELDVLWNDEHDESYDTASTARFAAAQFVAEVSP